MRYCILLKAINVSGKNIVKMDKLRVLLQQAGFSEVQTYIQSGNIVAEHPDVATEIIAKKIEELVYREFSVSTTAFVYTPVMFKAFIAANPFVKKRNASVESLHLTFLHSPPDKSIAAGLKIMHAEDEAFEISGSSVYLYCPNGYGNTKLTNAVFEKKLGITATTRNWKTVLLLQDKLES